MRENRDREVPARPPIAAHAGTSHDSHHETPRPEPRAGRRGRAPRLPARRRLARGHAEHGAGPPQAALATASTNLRINCLSFAVGYLPSLNSSFAWPNTPHNANVPNAFKFILLVPSSSYSKSKSSASKTASAVTNASFAISSRSERGKTSANRMFRRRRRRRSTKGSVITNRHRRSNATFRTMR